MNNSVELVANLQDRFQTTQATNASYSLDQQKVFTQWMTEHEKLLRHMITGFEAKPAIQDVIILNRRTDSPPSTETDSQNISSGRTQTP